MNSISIRKIIKKSITILTVFTVFIFLTSCGNMQKPFVSSLKEGRYKSTSEYITSNDEVTELFVELDFRDRTIMEYVKRNGKADSSLVKDLYTVNDRFYLVYSVDITIIINGNENKVMFQNMKSKDLITTSEYKITGLNTEIEGLKYIYVNLIDEDDDKIAEAMDCELVFEDETYNITTRLENNDVKYKLELVDPENVCLDSQKGGTTYELFSGDEIRIYTHYSSTNEETDPRIYVKLSDGTIIKGTQYDRLKLYFDITMPEDNLVATVIVE